jgi:exodeoxyribonuclease V alpha subunit
MRVALLAPGEDRDARYAANPAYAATLVEDVIPALRDAFDTVGRPVLVTQNDAVNRVANGDVGVVVADGTGVAVALPQGPDVRTLPVSRLHDVDTWWAMTIHKSQGSEFPHVVVSLPQAGSPILTRELLYTGVTRAKERLTVVASEAAIRAAVERPVARASGLAARLA